MGVEALMAALTSTLLSGWSTASELLVLGLVGQAKSGGISGCQCGVWRAPASIIRVTESALVVSWGQVGNAFEVCRCCVYVDRVLERAWCGASLVLRIPALIRNHAGRASVRCGSPGGHHLSGG